MKNFKLSKKIEKFDQIWKYGESDQKTQKNNFRFWKIEKFQLKIWTKNLFD